MVNSHVKRYLVAIENSRVKIQHNETVYFLKKLLEIVNNDFYNTYQQKSSLGEASFIHIYKI